MKQICLPAILFLGCVHFATAQYYSQYFDGADTSWYNSIIIELDTASENIWQIGPPQKMIFDSAATQPNAIVTDTVNFYPTNNTSRFIANLSKDWGNWGIFVLRWMQKLDMDEGFDGGIIEYTLDSGTTWVNVFNNPYVYSFYGFQEANRDTLANGEFAFSGTDSTWRDIWLCFDFAWLDFFDFEDTLQFRFTLLTDSVDNSKEGWLIDNMLAYLSVFHTVNKGEQESYLHVYPNPASSIVHIQAQKLMEFHIIESMELVDPLGRVVESWTNIPTKFWINVNRYPEGLYSLRIRTNIRSETIPLLIARP
jgi:hypothetical protein